MTSVTHSFVVLAPPEQIWRALSDFNRWGAYFIVEGAQAKGWGNRWQAQGEPSPGATVALYHGQALAQEWAIEEWAPPKRLKLASRAWHGPAQTQMDSIIDFAVEPRSLAETQVVIRFESRFSHPALGFFLYFVPLKGEFKRILDRFEQGLIAALSGA